VSASSACGSGGVASLARIAVNSPNTLNGDVVYDNSSDSPTEVFGTTLNGNTLKGFTVSCTPYNANDSIYNTLDATGITGGVYTFYDYSPTFTVPPGTVIGTVTIPTAPEAGPYVNSVTTTLGTPYTLPAGDQLVFNITGTSNGNQTWIGCQAYADI
jgi:hypothetical protein